MEATIVGRCSTSMLKLKNNHTLIKPSVPEQMFKNKKKLFETYMVTIKILKIWFGHLQKMLLLEYEDA